MNFMTTEVMPPSHPSWGLTLAPSQARSSMRPSQQDRSRSRHHYTINDVPRTYQDPGEPRSLHRIRRRRDAEVRDVVDDRRLSRDFPRDFDSILAEPSESSWSGRGQELIRQPTAGRRNSHRSPPPDEFGWSPRGQSNRRLPYPLEQRGHDLHGFGSWCESTTVPHQRFQIEAFRNSEDAFESRRSSTLTVPSTPREHLLPAPDLPPMSTHFVFCPCCGDEDEADRINETWHMASKEKMDTQMEHAIEYIARMKLENGH